MGAGVELYARCKDGSEIRVDISLYPVFRGLRTLTVVSIRPRGSSKWATHGPTWGYTCGTREGIVQIQPLRCQAPRQAFMNSADVLVNAGSWQIAASVALWERLLWASFGESTGPQRSWWWPPKRQSHGNRMKMWTRRNFRAPACASSQA